MSNIEIVGLRLMCKGLWLVLSFFCLYISLAEGKQLYGIWTSKELFYAFYVRIWS